MEKVRSCMINIISKRELSNSVIYELDDNILRSNIISILKMFENGKHKFGECSCSTWDEDGHVMRPCFHSIDELEKLKEYPSPDMSFDVDYVNSDTAQAPPPSAFSRFASSVDPPWRSAASAATCSPRPRCPCAARAGSPW